MPDLPAGDAVDRQRAQMDVAQVVEDQLAALKRQLGEATPPVTP